MNTNKQLKINNINITVESDQFYFIEISLFADVLKIIDLNDYAIIKQNDVFIVSQDRNQKQHNTLEEAVYYSINLLIGDIKNIMCRLNDDCEELQKFQQNKPISGEL